MFPTMPAAVECPSDGSALPKMPSSGQSLPPHGLYPVSELQIRKYTISLTKRELGKEMVHNVVMGRTVQKELSTRPKEVSIDRRCSTSNKRPLPPAVSRNSSVGVLQVGQRDKPVAHEQPWDAVELQYGAATPPLGSFPDSVGHCAYSNVGEDNVA